MPAKIQTRERAAKRAKDSLEQRVLRWTSVAFNVAYLIQEVRSWIQTELPVLARETLAKLGLSYGADDPLTIAGLTAVVSRDSGVPLRDLSDATKTLEDVEMFALATFREATGVDLTSLKPDEIREQIQALAVASAQQNAPPSLVLTAKFLRQMRNAARDAYRHGNTLSLGAPFSECLYRWHHREAQRTYGRAHIQRWEPDDVVSKRKVFGRYRTVSEEKVQKAWRRNCRIWRKVLKGVPLAPWEIINWIVPDGTRVGSRFWTLTEFQRYRKKIGKRPLDRKRGKRRNWWSAGRDLRGD